MRGTTRTVAVAVMSAAALLAAGCGSGSGSGSTTAGKDGGEITIHGCTPENPFVPANTNETCGGNVLDAVLAKLVHYNPDTAAPENDIADAIETKDNQTFTIKLKKGYKFQDGTEVKAHNFVDAWNWNRDGKNGTLNSYFFDPIEGSADMDCGPGADKKPDCTAHPAKASKLSGLKVVDDYTFTIKTTEKVSNLPVRLGYTAFAPLPDSFFADGGKSFGTKPIGAGPYTFEKYDQGSQIALVKNKDYSGKFPGHADKLTFKIYTDTEAAYKDVQAGQLDLLDSIPTSALAGDKYKTDLPDRNLNKPVGVFQSIAFPKATADPTYQNKDLRHALSMAIDRDTIIKQVLNNTKKPATGWVSPVVDGYKAGACGDYCKYDKAKAKEAFTKAGGYNGTITLSYNANGDHKAWTEAVCNSIKDALGVTCVATPIAEFSDFRKQINSGTMKGMFRTGWQMDYPSIENFLAPLYGTGAGSNDSGYSNPDFDKKLTEAAAATDPATANKDYQDAEALLAADMPVIPMWYSTATVGWSDKVTNVKVTPFGTFDLSAVSLK